MIYRLSKFFRINKLFYIPPQKKILIYDHLTYEKIKNILDLKNVGVLDTRTQINLVIIFICLLKFKISKISYFEEYIKFVNPKIIITFTDNDIRFYLLKKRLLNNVIFVSIQNGWRSFSNDIFEQLQKSSCKNDFSSDWILTFNDSVGLEYKKYITTNTLAIGNIINNHNYYADISKNKKIPDSILLVSQWVENSDQISAQLMNSIFKFLQNYSASHKKLLGILLRGDSEEEKIFYNKHGIQNFHFIKKNKVQNSYYWVDKYELTITIDSTLGYESLSRGNKTLFFNIRSSYDKFIGYSFGWPMRFSDQGFIWSGIDDEKYFEKLIDKTLKCQNDIWIKQIEKNNLNKIMVYDKNNMLIKNFLKSIFKILNIYV